VELGGIIARKCLRIDKKLLFLDNKNNKSIIYDREAEKEKKHRGIGRTLKIKIK
jgi:hypothetical protein